MTENGVEERPVGKPLAGDLRVLAGVRSPELDNVRDILVYLPPSHGRGGGPFPVVYMHDGQNLFDPATSFAGEWRVNDTLERLSAEGIEAIVVGVPNMGVLRVDEYSPFPDAQRGGGRGDAYLAFIVGTLKPEIDRRFRTRPDRDGTGIMGSSMGGLISLYGFLRHPDVFGFAGVMSPALWFADRAIFRAVAGVAPWSGRVYLDIGTGEDRRAVLDARRMSRFLARTAADPGRGLMYVEERGARHHESAWAGRFERAARFLIPHSGTRPEQSLASSLGAPKGGTLAPGSAS